MGEYRIIRGRVEDALDSGLGPFDAVLTDPPYGLAFMGKDWDKVVPTKELWATVLGVMRPGAHMLAFGGTRTFHRLAVAIEDAGWELRDTICWMYGSGFPKSHDVSKGIDKAAGAERESIGQYIAPDGKPRGVDLGIQGGRFAAGESNYVSEKMVTAPATPEALRFQGYGTALKPSWEPVILAMKPNDGTFANNALTHGVAGLNVDGGRVETSEDRSRPPRTPNEIYGNGGGTNLSASESHPEGRWPANIILDEEAAARLDAEVGDLVSGGTPFSRSGMGYHGASGQDSVDGSHGDSGGASRFFYVAKADTAERTMGGRIENKHPTLKPVDLTAYLAKLLLPPEREDGEPRRILVPFCGAGSEMIGALRAGWDEVVGIECEQEYADTASTRCRMDAPMFNIEVTA